MPLAAAHVQTAMGPLLESSWQAGLLALLVLAVQRLFRPQLSPAWRHALWWIVLGRLLIPVPPASPWSLFNLLPQPRNPVQPQSASLLTAKGWEPAAAPGFQPLLAIAPETTARGTHLVLTDRPEATGSDQAPGPAWSLMRQDLGSILAGIWTTGTLLLLGRLGLQNLLFARRVRALMRPACPALQAQLDDCRRRMRVGRSVDLLEGDAVPSPAVYGMLRPRLLLPRHVAASGSPECLDSIFLHELAHVRRGDLWVHALTRVLQAVHWFNPVLLWAFRRSRLDRELATDALVLEVASLDQRRAYGLTILTLLERWSKPAPQPGAVGILEDNASLEQRIRAIAQFRPASRWAPLSGILVAVLAAASWTGAQDPPSQPASRAPAPAEPAHARQSVSPSRLESAGAAPDTDRTQPPRRNDDGAREVDALRDDIVSRRIAEARYLFQVGDWRKADETIQRAAELAPTHAEALTLQQRIRDARKFEAGHAQGDGPTGRERILALLESIRLPEVGFDRVPLKEVVRQLKDWSRERDPAGHGVNFFTNPYLDAPTPAPASIDPHTGEVVAPQTAEPIALGDITVRIEPPLRDVRLLDVLTVLTASAESPIHFTVEDYAVVFLNGPPRPRLVTRIFRIAPQGFAHGLESTQQIRQTNDPASGPVPTSPPALQAKVRQLFQDLGVSLLPPNAVYFNDGRGLLMVRATEPEIEVIERTVDALNEGKMPVWVPATNVLSALVPPPQPGPASVSVPQDVLTVLPQSPWMLNGKAMPEARRETELRALRRLRPEGPQHLRIEGDPRVGWRELSQAVDLARKAGFEQVSFSVIEAPRTEWPTPEPPGDRTRVR